MTDTQLDELIDRAKPDLRIALRAVLSGGGSDKAAHLFNIGRIPLPKGGHWDITCVMLTEPQTKMLEALLHGVQEMQKCYVYAVEQGVRFG
jgi:hypothetical protein